MRFANFDDATFTRVFGEEGFDLIADYTNDIFLVGNEQAAQMGLPPSFGAAVVHQQYPGAGAPVPVLVVNVEACYDEMDFFTKLSPSMMKKKMRAMLVHERTHIKQMEEGRLVNLCGVHYWEGQKVEIAHGVTDEYFHTPWEIEAYVNQFMYQHDMTAEEARAHLDATVISLKAA